MHKAGFQPDRLRQARKAKSYSQNDLASKIGSDPVTVSRWERGQFVPRGKVLEFLAKALDVKPQWFFLDVPEDSEQVAEASTPYRAKTVPDPRLATRIGEALLATEGHYLYELLTDSENPLDYDRDLWDRQLVELQQVGPQALRGARDHLSLSLADVAKLTGLSSKRLADIEIGHGPPLSPGEILKLREGLGVKFEPRAVAYSGLSLQPTKDKRSAEAKLEESVRTWMTECRRTPNKLDTILARLDQLQRKVDAIERRLAEP